MYVRTASMSAAFIANFLRTTMTAATPKSKAHKQCGWGLSLCKLPMLHIADIVPGMNTGMTRRTRRGTKPNTSHHILQIIDPLSPAMMQVTVLYGEH